MRAGDQGDADLFPKTSWSLIGRAADGSSVLNHQALGELVSRYRPALRTYLTRGRRMSEDAAEDLLQEFIVNKILAQGLVARAQAEKGKFRTFLLASLRNYLIDSARAAGARKRKMDKATAGPFDAIDASDPRMKEPPRVFEEAWAREVVHRAIALMQQECQAEKRLDLWTVFQDRLLIPSREDSQPVSYEVLMGKLGLKSMEQVSNLQVTAKRMYSRSVRAAIAEYVGEEHVDQEIFDLREALGRASPR